MRICGHTPYNILNSKTIKELSAVLSALEKDETIKVLIITGEGEKSFSCGADIKELASMDDGNIEEYVELGNKAYMQIQNFHCPVIASVNGFAFGAGFELALACDIRFMAKETILGQPAVRHGLVPPFGGTQRLPQIVGIGKAKEILFGGLELEASEALEIGLVNRVYPREKLFEETLKYADKICNNKQHAVKLTKKAVNYWLEPEHGYKAETEGLIQCIRHKETRKQLSSFFDKKKS